MHQRLELNTLNDNILYISKSSIDDSFNSSLHSHPNLELILITTGSGEIVTSNNKLKVKMGDLIIINPNTAHYETGYGLSFYALGIQKLDIYLKDTFTNNIIVNEFEKDDFNELNIMYNLIFRNGENKDSESRVIISSSYKIIYSLLKRKYNCISNSSNTESDIVLNIKNIINKYYSSDFKLEEIAKRLNSSISNICHIFKKETNQTIIEYKIDKQLEEAFNLLKVSDMSIIDISTLVGFNNVSYFIKQFKKKYNKTPKEIKIS